MKTVLVVEDDARIATALKVRLEAAGYGVVTAADGREALVSVMTRKPDLIITDIWMPKPIGFLNEQRLHQFGLAGVPVIYITASKKKDLRRVAEEEGAFAFFEKPYDSKQLLAAVAEALSQKPGASGAGDPPKLKQPHKKKILIVDDDIKLCAALGIRLKAAGYRVLAALDVTDGLSLAVESRPDLMILDLWMPGGVGLLLAQRLKNLGLGEMPVVLLTASRKKDVWHIAQDVDPAAFFEKPCDPKQLLNTISRLLTSTSRQAASIHSTRNAPSKSMYENSVNR